MLEQRSGRLGHPFRMAPSPPRKGKEVAPPRLQAMDQRSLLKVSMKSRSEQMKTDRDKAYANKGLHHKKKLRSMMRARLYVERAMPAGPDPASGKRHICSI